MSQLIRRRPAAGQPERVFSTLQDRLPKKFALTAITTAEAANKWLREICIPAHNKRFAVTAEQPASAFVITASDAR